MVDHRDDTKTFALHTSADKLTRNKARTHKSHLAVPPARRTSFLRLATVGLVCSSLAPLAGYEVSVSHWNATPQSPTPPLT